MNKKTILLLITILVFSIMGGVIWSYFTYGDNGTRFVRKNANSVEAQSDMEAMNKALTIMREKGCTDPASWYYQVLCTGFQIQLVKILYVNHIVL